nr:hypothetical protein GCM10025730_52710 [Promicromonospora thailandica]
MVSGLVSGLVSDPARDVASDGVPGALAGASSAGRPAGAGDVFSVLMSRDARSNNGAKSSKSSGWPGDLSAESEP